MSSVPSASHMSWIDCLHRDREHQLRRSWCRRDLRRLLLEYGGSARILRGRLHQQHYRDRGRDCGVAGFHHDTQSRRSLRDDRCRANLHPDRSACANFVPASFMSCGRNPMRKGLTPGMPTGFGMPRFARVRGRDKLPVPPPGRSKLSGEKPEADIGAEPPASTVTAQLELRR
jgi:hypothetical protein